MWGRDFQKVYRSDFDLAPKSPLYRFVAVGSAKPVFVRVPIFGLAFLLFAAVACGAPPSQSASLLHLPKMHVQNCANQFTTSFSMPLLISAHLAFYSPASLAVCANEASTFTPDVQSPTTSSQHQPPN